MASLVGLTLVIVIPAAGSGQTDERHQRATRYLELVDRYRAGESRRVVEELATWESEHLDQLLHDLPARLSPSLEPDPPATLDPLRDPRKPTPLEWLATAMTAHAEVARLAENALEIDRHLQFAQRLWDGGLRVERSGQRLSFSPPDSQPRLRFMAHWHLVAAAIWIGSLDLPRTRHHLEIARRLQPNDPLVLLAVGSLHETEAAMLGYHPSGSQQRAGGQAMAVEHLEQARHLYESALARDPALGEARVRLARTRRLLGRLDEAAREAARALVDVRDPYTQYLAALIAGGIEEDQGRWTEAAGRYRTAHRLCGGCQSATLALSHVLLRSGDPVFAAQLVDGLLSARCSSGSDDPWWLYYRGQWQRVDGMLEALRKEVPR